MQTFPLISVRDVVIFPGNKNPLAVGRDFTLSAIRESVKNFDNEMVISSQKLIAMNDKPNMNQIFDVGCLCKIIDQVEFSDGTMKILVEGRHRFKIKKISDHNGARFCEGALLKDFNDPVSPDRKKDIINKFEANKGRWAAEEIVEYKRKIPTGNVFQFVMNLGYLLGSKSPIKRGPTLDQIREGIFFIDTLSEEEQKTINVQLARIQEILESDSAKIALKKIEALL